MNILFAKNNTKKTIVVNDIPTMPAIAPGETINLLEFATASALKKSATLPTLFDSQFLVEVKPQSEEPEPWKDKRRPDAQSIRRISHRVCQDSTTNAQD